MAMSGNARDQERRIAVLHQAAAPPAVNGVRKPMKPGGYQDSGADIAFCLSHSPNTKVLTPNPSPNPAHIEGWTYPDTTSGILSALKSGATHLWANTILFASHPLQVAAEFEPYLDSVFIVGQPPLLVEVGDDKEFVNDVLRSKTSGGMFTLPRAWGVESVDEARRLEGEGMWRYPVVGKPVRGRGSSGVRVCADRKELLVHIASLLQDSSRAMIEEFLTGEEATVTILPSGERGGYYALPPVVRTGQVKDVAPWNGTVAVSKNSRVVTEQEMVQDGGWREVMEECVRATAVLGAMGVVRIDVRRFADGEDGKKGKLALFDVNLKPNMTGPGRPGRDDQTNLCGIAASGLGWGFERLLSEMLNSAKSLREVRTMIPTLVIEN